MVSLRRRKLLGFCTGVENSVSSTQSLIDINEIATTDTTIHNSNNLHSIPLYDLNIRAEEENETSGEIGPSKICVSNNSYDQNDQPNTFGLTLSKELDSHPITVLKQRKQQRRKNSNNHEYGSMRGVYFKNSKWQAAIKVDKKQIHLGTVSSPNEAAHLYDRAAYMCGREPNFELSEKEKQELSKLEWDEFMAITRNAISSKRSRRGRVIGKSQPLPQNSDWEGEQADGYSVSDGVVLDKFTY
ncbi:hypothetical protein RDABS01_015766 [Bienertia sinuspersici]